MEFQWINGRTLSQITVNPEDENGIADVYSYTYDESGIRSSKTVNGVTTYFTTKDGVILSQTDGTNTMYFQYDNSGNPTGFLYNGTQYFYLTNQMGDVIGITDNSGSLIATYTYGAWGEVLAVTPATTGNTAQLSVANANPLRYRGYYLDQETGYYYLQSRYYYPSLLRFINSDLLEISSVSKDNSTGQNLFSYCLNSPINNSDLAGTVAINIVIGALLGAVFGALGALLSDACDYILKHFSINKKMIRWRNVAIGAVSGALSGAVSFSKQKKWVVRVVSGLAGYWNARMTGFSRLGALIYATIIMVMINDGGFGRYLGRFSRKGLSFSNRTKKLSRAAIKKVANVLTSAISSYIRNNKTLYKRFIQTFISSSMQTWLVTYKISRVKR